MTRNSLINVLTEVTQRGAFYIVKMTKFPKNQGFYNKTSHSASRQFSEKAKRTPSNDYYILTDASCFILSQL